jgi:glucokinase
VVRAVKKAYASIAIGGTKCSLVLGVDEGEEFSWLSRSTFVTPPSAQSALSELVRILEEALSENSPMTLQGVGIVCGGPMDENAGLILSPPNLVGWGRFDLVTPFRDHFQVPVRLMNDANAAVLAEWAWGNARGAASAVYLTMGTGMGAGILLNGRLLQGSSGNAGEVGHWRLAETGPRGYGKSGSFEGFCSGGGIARLAQEIALVHLQNGTPADFAPKFSDLESITAASVAAASADGDPVATQIWADVGSKLGLGVSMIIDLLNPEVIVIGGIFNRQRDLLEPTMREVLEQECLTTSLAACRIVPSGLGESIDDYAGLAAALPDAADSPIATLLSSARG